MTRIIVISSVAAILLIVVGCLIYLDRYANHLAEEFPEKGNGISANKLPKNVPVLSEPQTQPTQEENGFNDIQPFSAGESSSSESVPITDFTTELIDEEVCCEDELVVQEDRSTPKLSWAERTTQELIEKYGDIPEVHTYVRLAEKQKRQEIFTPHEFLDLLRVTAHIYPYPENAKAYERFQKFVARQGVDNVTMKYGKPGEKHPHEKTELMWDK